MSKQIHNLMNKVKNKKQFLPCCPEFMPQISGIAWPVFVVMVKISWQRPPLISVVRAGAFVVNCSKSSLISQTAKTNWGWILVNLTF